MLKIQIQDLSYIVAYRKHALIIVKGCGPLSATNALNCLERYFNRSIWHFEVS